MRFTETFEGSLENPGKGLQGLEKRSRSRLGNFSRIPRDTEYLERGDEEEAKQGKESTEDRNKEDEQKVSASGGDERESHGAARPDEEEKQEG